MFITKTINESVELDSFREDTMEKAKTMINDFISKLKVKWTKFLAYVNTQIIKFCDKNINSFVKQNKSILGISKRYSNLVIMLKLVVIMLLIDT